MRLVPALAVVVALPLAVWWLARRSGAGTGSPVRVVARAGLGHKASVALVEVAARRFLVGATDQGVQLLSEIDFAPEEPPALGELAGNDDADRPWTGPIHRLQQMTLRRGESRRRPWRAVS